MLTAEQRTRFARHLLLAEIGERGQAELCRSEVGIPASGDPVAARVAEDYLQRAGLSVTRAPTLRPNPATQTASMASMARVLPRSRVDALAGAPELHAAAGALAGAFAAVEAIKACTGAGVPAELPVDLCLLAPAPAATSDDGPQTESP